MKILCLLILLINLNSVLAQLRGEYSLEKLSQLDSIPYGKVTSLAIDYSKIQSEWIPLVSQLKNVRKVTFTWSPKKNRSNLYDEALNESFGKIDSLKFISFYFDSLGTIPSIFENLRQVEELYINGNYLGAIPESIKFLKNLEDFKFSVENFEEFPNEISELKKLTDLYIYSKNLKTFPKCIEKLENLRSFSIVSDEITFVPDVWEDLCSLESLEFVCPKMKKVEGNMAELISLEDLKFKKAISLTRLPSSLGSLPKLEWLVIEGAWNLKHVGNLGQSNSLVWLSFDSKNLAHFLKDIGRLDKQLTSLEIGVFETMDLSDAELYLLRGIKKIELKTDYFVENGPKDYLRLYFGRNVTQEQTEELNRVYGILPQIVKLNL